MLTVVRKVKDKEAGNAFYVRHLDDVYVYGHSPAAYEQAALGVWRQVDRCGLASYNETTTSDTTRPCQQQ